MFRNLLFLSFLLLSLEFFGQDSVNQTDLTGKKQGFWRKLNSKGEKIYEGHFMSDIPVGEFRYFYPDGKLKTLSVISDSGRLSKTVSYYQNGKKMAEGIYRSGRKDSLWRFYSEYDGNLSAEEFYKEGKKDGLSKNYYPGQGVSEILHWKNGLKDGEWTGYYTDGSIKLNGFYKGDEKEGVFKTFYASGSVMSIGLYSDGHAQGTWSYYNPKGSLEKLEIYKDGLLIRTEDKVPEKK
jgi:antitoxin component YwqK of YwqJK toxin-antitoxin module